MNTPVGHVRVSHEEAQRELAERFANMDKTRARIIEDLVADAALERGSIVDTSLAQQQQQFQGTQKRRSA